MVLSRGIAIVAITAVTLAGLGVLIASSGQGGARNTAIALADAVEDYGACSSGFVSTGFDNTGGEETETQGVMFDLEVTAAASHRGDRISIVAFDLNMERTRTHKMDVYTRLGTHVGREAVDLDDSGDDVALARWWTGVGGILHLAEGRGENVPTRLTLNTTTTNNTDAKIPITNSSDADTGGVVMPPHGQRRAFYIHQRRRDDIQTIDHRRRGGSAASAVNVSASDSNLIMYVGTAINGRDIVAGLTLSGTVHYTVCPTNVTRECSVQHAEWLGDGRCDVGGYNTRECGFDGGDCCSATCVPGPNHRCDPAGMECLDPEFAPPPGTYWPGLLTKKENGLLLSSGLRSKIIARSGKRVRYADGSKSIERLHNFPDGAAVFESPRDKTWVYVSNSEEEEDFAGGVGVLTFDEEGNVTDYRMILVNTTKNCSGGRTPWNTWVSCEETLGKGQIFEVDPFGNNIFESDQGERRTWQRTELAAIDNGDRYEAMACDNRHPGRPVFYVTNDKEDGEVRRFIPDDETMKQAVRSGDYRRVLSTVGTIEYLVLNPDSVRDDREGVFYWDGNRTKGQKSAKMYYNSCEGIEFNEQDGILYFVSKSQSELFVLDVDHFTFKKFSTNIGSLTGQPDQLKLCTSGDDQMLYFSEEGGSEGIHARNHRGEFVTILKGIGYDEETTGIAFSPDKRHLYFSQRVPGHIFDITREDGYPFSGKSLPLEHM